jgi:glycosyltransferase involved in cell wall biosynthesis
MPGIIASEDLPALLSGAKVFVYASSFEGFGLPVLEAMACGTPVITSNATSLPEVAGNAALMVTPGKVGELVETLLLVLRDEALRHDMREQGLRRARLFSWERTARETLAVYERAVKLRRRNTFDQQR